MILPMITFCQMAPLLVSNTATAGLRSGDFANTRNSIDSVLNNASRSSQATNVAPGILSITGLFDNGTSADDHAWAFTEKRRGCDDGT